MIIAHVDRDYINKDGDIPSRVGVEWSEDAIVIPDREAVREEINGGIAGKVRFRLKDDDGEIYYGGWLYNDSFGCTQMVVLAWGQHDAGCTTIEVKGSELPEFHNREWKQEIG
jgi:hypothetical protein